MAESNHIRNMQDAIGYIGVDQEGKGMTDYSKLVAALRCELHYTSCPETNCKYICHDTFCDTYRLMIDAAAAIETLQAEVKILKVSGREAYFEGLAADDNRRQVKELAKRNAELHAELEKWVSAAEKAGEPKRGEWTTKRTWNHDGEIYCSVCEHDAPTDGDYRQVKTNYCPNCGAKMEANNG